MENNRLNLFVVGFKSDQSYSEIFEICQSYGKFSHLIRPRGKTFIFLEYETEKQAAEAKSKFDRSSVRCEYSHAANYNRSPTSSLRSHRRRGNYPALQRADQDNASKDHESFAGRRGGTALDDLFKAGENIFIKSVDGLIMYALPADPMFAEQYAFFMKMIAKYGQTADGIACPIKKHTWALALHKGRYTRVIVTNFAIAGDEYVPVYYYDIGLHKDVAIEQLRVLDTSYKEKCWVRRFQLDGIRLNRTQQAASTFLETFVDRKVQIASIRRNGQYSHDIEVIDPGTGQNINQIVNHLNFKFKVDQLGLKQPTLGLYRSLYIVDCSLLKQGDNLMAIIDNSDCSAFESQQEQIQAFGNTVEALPEYYAEVDDVAIVRIDKRWYRLVLTDYVQQKALVHLIDCCRSEYVDRKDIRNIDANIGNLPILVFAAQFDGYSANVNAPEVFDLISFVEKSKALTVHRLSSNCESIYSIKVSELG